MKLGLKIILPILLLLIVLLGSFRYLLSSLEQQETVISKQLTRIQKLNSLNERLKRQQEQTDYNTLSYVFDQNRAFLQEISQAEIDKSKTLDEMYPYITSSRGRELVNNYIFAKKGVELLWNGLIIAIDTGDTVQIKFSYNRWNIQTQNIKAALTDIQVYNINSLEKTLTAVDIIRAKISQIMTMLALIIIATVIFIYFYLRVFIIMPLIKLAHFADEIANKNFTTTTTTTGINSNDEIGMLSRSFNTMSMKLKAYYMELEQKVENRTKYLSIKISELEETKKATLNILEDLQLSQKRAEILANDLEKFKLAVDNTSDMVLITDPEGIVLYGNKAVEKVTGYTSKEALGEKSGTLWKKPMSPEYYQILWDTIKNKKKTYTGEIQNKRKSGEIYTAILNISPILDNNGEIIYFVAIERDISKDKEIEMAKDEFLAITSHELRTPLAVIKGNASMLIEGVIKGVSGEAKNVLGDIYESSERLVGLVNSFLDVSRMSLGKISFNIKDIDITKICIKVINQFNGQLEEKGLKVKYTPLDNLPFVVADPEKFEQVMVNLLGNSIRYSQKGEIVVNHELKNGFIETLVTDFGIGISKEMQKLLFTKFQQGADGILNRQSGSTGLGLFISKMLLEKMDGKIYLVRSELGKGSTFGFTLPVANK